jgi:hypothetical protein
MYCKACDNKISKARLEVLPNTEYCIECADKHTADFKGFMVFSHKTAPELIKIPLTNSEAIRQAERANARAR